MKARERIIEAAVEICNREGAHVLTTNHVIDEIRISPGTLYYHFKNKEEIIRTVFSLIEDDFARLWKEAEDVSTPAELVNRLRAMYGLFYRYRFFYRDLPMLLARDPVLAVQYRKNHDIKQKMISGIIDTLTEKGFIEHAPGPEEKSRLLESIWILSEYRIAYLFSTGEEVSQDTVLQGVKNMVSLISPYFSRSGQEDLSTISGT